MIMSCVHFLDHTHCSTVNRRESPSKSEVLSWALPVAQNVYLDLGTLLHFLLLGDGVGHHHSLEGCIVDPRYGGAGEDAMSQDGIHLDGPSRDQSGREQTHQDSQPKVHLGSANK